MQIRRLTRLTDGFSKKATNLKAAPALCFAWYNFCRVHQTLRVTPAMEARFDRSYLEPRRSFSHILKENTALCLNRLIVMRQAVHSQPRPESHTTSNWPAPEIRPLDTTTKCFSRTRRTQNPIRILRSDSSC